MNSAPLSAAQLDAYRRDGYLVVVDLLTPEEVDRFVRYEADHDPGTPRGLQNHRVDAQWAAIAGLFLLLCIIHYLSEGKKKRP